MRHYILSLAEHLDVRWCGFQHGSIGMERVHANPYYTLLMVTEGPVYLDTEGEHLTLQSGECLLLRPWQQHLCWQPFADPAGFYWVQIAAGEALPERTIADSGSAQLHVMRPDPVGLQTQASDHPVLLPYRHRPAKRYELLNTFESLVEAFCKPTGSYDRLRWQILLLQIVEQIAGDYLEQHQLTEALPGTLPLYRKLVNYMNEFYDQDLNMKVLEQHMERTYEYLCQVFKAHSGMTIGSYIQQLRLQRAKHLLQTTAKSVADITYEVGYRNPLYFSKMFKKLTGVAPSVYARQLRALGDST